MSNLTLRRPFLLSVAQVAHFPQISEVADKEVHIAVANKRRILYTQDRGRGQKARNSDCRLHSRSAQADAVGWKELSSIGVFNF